MSRTRPGEIAEVLLSEERIRTRVAELGRDISRDYPGRPLVVVGVLKGSFVFLADLIRAIDLPISVDFVGISSYLGTSTSGAARSRSPRIAARRPWR